MERLSQHGWHPVDPPRRSVLFVNPRSGGGRATRAAVAERARERGIDVIVLDTHQSLGELVRGAVAEGADALGVAGGDGTLAVVAAAARVHGLAFVCVPAGTRNHFALDLGVDRHDLVGALDAFTDGVERSIDVGEVNGRVFLNNVSLGIYGDAVRQPAYRDAKVRTLVETAAEVLGTSGAVPELHVVDDLGNEHRRPAVVLVSNNPYALDRSIARSRRGPGRGSTRASSALSCSTHHAPARILPDGPGEPRSSRWARQHRCAPASTARRSSFRRHSSSSSGPERCA
jgi:diacylglycerol kinase family enzyme